MQSGLLAYLNCEKYVLPSRRRVTCAAYTRQLSEYRDFAANPRIMFSGSAVKRIAGLQIASEKDSAADARCTAVVQSQFVNVTPAHVESILSHRAYQSECGDQWAHERHWVEVHWWRQAGHTPPVSNVFH